MVACGSLQGLVGFSVGSLVKGAIHRVGGSCSGFVHELNDVLEVWTSSLILSEVEDHIPPPGLGIVEEFSHNFGKFSYACRSPRAIEGK